MKRRSFLKSSLALATTSGLPSLSQAATSLPSVLTHRVDDRSAPIVYFIKGVSGQDLLRAYDALNQNLRGKVGIKMTFETPNGPHLDPQLVKALATHTKGTLIDSNCFSPRDTTQKHLAVARGNGFDDSIAPIDILDSEGSMDIPVPNGFPEFDS